MFALASAVETRLQTRVCPHLRHKLSFFQVMCHHHCHQLPVEHKVQHGRPLLLLQQAAPQCRAAEVDAHQVLQRILALAGDA
jgi:hypothetical protein